MLSETRLLVLVTSAILLSNLAAIASAISENEPTPERVDVLASAIDKVRSLEIDELTTKYDPKENTSYYLREAEFLGRFMRESRTRVLIRLCFVRSSPYEEGNHTPPRGHCFLVLFDDELNYITHQRLEFDAEAVVSGDDILVEGLPVMSLSSPKTN